MYTDVGSGFDKIVHPDRVSASVDVGPVILGDPVPDAYCWEFMTVEGVVTSPSKKLTQKVAFEKQLSPKGRLHFTTETAKCEMWFDPKGKNIEVKFGNAPDSQYAKREPDHHHQDWDTHFELYYQLTENGAKGAPLPYFVTTCGEKVALRSKTSLLSSSKLYSPHGLDCPPAFFTP
jgi:hypothetical protein